MIVFEAKLEDALKLNDRLANDNVQLKKALTDLKQECARKYSAKNKPQTFDILSDTESSIVGIANTQTSLLINQKEKLETIKSDVMQFNKELKDLYFTVIPPKGGIR